MKIAFIPSTFLPWIGGAEIQTHNAANKLAENGHEVDIFLLDKGQLIDQGKYDYLNNKYNLNVFIKNKKLENLK